MSTADLEQQQRKLAFDLADRLRKSLRVSGVSVQEMSDYLEVSRNTVGRWVNGHYVPSRAELIAWALRTGVPVAWLETGTIQPRGRGDGPGLRRRRPQQDSNLQPSDCTGNPHPMLLVA